MTCRISPSSLWERLALRKRAAGFIPAAFLRAQRERQATGPSLRTALARIVVIVWWSKAGRHVQMPGWIFLQHFERHFAAADVAGLLLDCLQELPSHSAAAIFRDDHQVVQIHDRLGGERGESVKTTRDADRTFAVEREQDECERLFAEALAPVSRTSASSGRPFAIGSRQ